MEDWEIRDKKVLNIAHRGASAYRPENTMEAFVHAITLGADIIEMDVRQTSDGHLVLLHDETVDRTTDGTGVIAELTLRQVKSLDAGMGNRVPILEEVFSQFSRDQVVLNLEIKCIGIEKRVLEMVHRLFHGDRVLISSFRPSVLRKVREMDKKMRIGLLVGKARSINPIAWMRRAFPLSTFAEVGADTLHQHVRLIHRYLIARCKREDIPLYAWVVNGEPQMRRLIRRGVNGIFTGRPDILGTVIHQEIGNGYGMGRGARRLALQGSRGEDELEAISREGSADAEVYGIDGRGDGVLGEHPDCR